MTEFESYVRRVIPRVQFAQSPERLETRFGARVAVTLSDEMIFMSGNAEELARSIAWKVQEAAIVEFNLEPVIAARLEAAVAEARHEGEVEGYERGAREARAALMREWQEAGASDE